MYDVTIHQCPNTLRVTMYTYAIHTACTCTCKYCVIQTKTPRHAPSACKHDMQLHITLYLRAYGVRAGVASDVYVVPSHVYVLLSNVKAFFFRSAACGLSNKTLFFIFSDPLHAGGVLTGNN